MKPNVVGLLRSLLLLQHALKSEFCSLEAETLRAIMSDMHAKCWNIIKLGRWLVGSNKEYVVSLTSMRNDKDVKGVGLKLAKCSK